MYHDIQINHLICEKNAIIIIGLMYFFIFLYKFGSEKMNQSFDIFTISTNKFYLIYFLSFFTIIAVSIYLAIVINEFFIFLIFISIILMIFVAKKIATKTLRLKIDDTALFIDEQKIEFERINGYHYNDQGLLMSSFDLLVDNKETINIPCSKSRKNLEYFHEFMKVFINQLYAINPSAHPMLYQEVHKKQMMVLRPIIILGIVLIAILDLYMLYALFTGGVFLWQILLFNIIILSFLPYLKKGKK